MFGVDLPPKVNDVPRGTLLRDAFDPRRGITWMVVPATVSPCWVSEPGKTACQVGELVCVALHGPGPEVCGNTLDEDCDGIFDDLA